MIRAALAVVVLAAGGSGATALPPASFTVPGEVTALAAAGPRVAIAANCTVRVADLAHGTKPVTLKQFGSCPGGDSGIAGLWLGRATLVAEIVDSPSPHGDTYTLWTGAAAGPLRALGEEWGWTDSDVPNGFGCAWSVASGGGTVALTTVPNRLAVDQGLEDKPACPAAVSTPIQLKDTTVGGTSVAGSWRLLATDGKRLALARLDDQGLSTGELSLVDLTGKALTAPTVDPAVVKAALGGWLAPEGLVLRTRTGVSGPGWTIAGVGSATVAEGRLVYAKGKTIRVRRLKDGADKPLLAVRGVDVRLAAGSFGVAIAAGNGDATTVYRLPWRTIDRVLR